MLESDFEYSTIRFGMANCLSLLGADFQFYPYVSGLKICGLDTFGQRVLFAKVLPQSDDVFWQFVSLVQDKLAKSSCAISVTNKFELTPHMTLVKVNRPISKLRKSKFLPSRLYEDYSNMDLGVQPINNLQLCVIEATTRNDVFYRTLSEIKFKLWKSQILSIKVTNFHQTLLTLISVLHS